VFIGGEKNKRYLPKKNNKKIKGDVDFFPQMMKYLF
jgi:hypothetical protein